MFLFLREVDETILQKFVQEILIKKSKQIKNEIKNEAVRKEQTSEKQSFSKVEPFK